MRETIDHRLPNGLRLVLQPDAAAPVVAVAITYDVGSRNEERGRSGFAHLFEHMMFEGSEHVAKGEFFRLVQGFGGQLNGSTSQDRTNYYESLPAHQLDLALWLEADRMRALAVTPENFENQRQTVMEERRQRVDNTPYGEAGVRFNELSYSCWAYAHPVIGYWDDLHDARFEDVADFHQRWYRPDNAVMAIAGDFDPDAALDRVQAWFGPIPAGGDRPAPSIDEPRRDGSAVDRMVAPLAQLPAVFLDHQAPSISDPDFFVYEVIETLLFSGPSSRIYRRLVVEDQVAVEVSGGYEARRGPSLFTLYAVGARGGDLDRIVALYQEELDRLVVEPVPERSLEKVRNQLRAGRLLSQENVLHRATALSRSTLFHGDPRWEASYLDAIGRVTAADIQRVAARDLRANAAVQLQVLPP